MFDMNWYNELNKPLFSPPVWIFTPVWCVLYITIFVSLLLFIVKHTAHRKILGYWFFSIQMILNLLWTPSFFVLKNILLALVVVIGMDIFIFLTIKEFYGVSRLAAVILVPYFIWSLFATYLTAGYLMLN